MSEKISFTSLLIETNQRWWCCWPANEGPLTIMEKGNCRWFVKVFAGKLGCFLSITIGPVVFLICSYKPHQRILLLLLLLLLLLRLLSRLLNENHNNTTTTTTRSYAAAAAAAAGDVRGCSIEYDLMVMMMMMMMLMMLKEVLDIDSSCRKAGKLVCALARFPVNKNSRYTIRGNP